MKNFRDFALWAFFPVSIWHFSFWFCMVTANAGPPSRAIVLGFDGVDYHLARKWIEEGKLPHLERLSSSGSFLPLKTSNPAQSPVAWASFATGNNPGKHNIFDFLRRGEGDYHPRLGLGEVKSVALLGGVYGKFAFSGGIGLFLGGIVWGAFRYRKKRAGKIFFLFPAALFGGIIFCILYRFLPECVPWPFSLKKGLSVWTIAGRHGIKTVTLGAPIAFPAEEAKDGKLMCGFGTPDMAGTNGIWFRYSTRFPQISSTETGGWKIPLEGESPQWRGTILGPRNILLAEEKTRIEKRLPQASSREIRSLRNRLAEIKRNSHLVNRIEVESLPGRSLLVTVENRSQRLKAGEWGDWMEVPFRMSPLLPLKGMVRIRVLESDPPELYMTPVQFHPLHLPWNVSLSFPSGFAQNLALENGIFPTLGWSEATNPLKDEQVEDEVCWEDIRQTMRQWEGMMWKEFTKGPFQLFMAIFYAPDRASHMFWRFMDEKHPRHEDGRKHPEVADAVFQVYRWMDEVVGKMAREMGPDDVLIVLSDHGFAPFRWEVNLNAWLRDQGYLFLKETGKGHRFQIQDLYESRDMGSQCDWSRTKAYAMGLGKIWINQVGREPQGIVPAGKPSEELCREIRQKLLAWVHQGEKVVREAYWRDTLYHGPYREEAPELTLGFESGYRVSWQTTLGGVPEKQIEPNLLKWSADHCSVDPQLIPGVLFCNRKIANAQVHIQDLAPTLLSLFGVPLPEMDGTPIRWAK